MCTQALLVSRFVRNQSSSKREPAVQAAGFLNRMVLT
jgi:hypothetical protein